LPKIQKATLDPSKISGYCGRLKCCLRYEDKTYTELKERLPRKNTIVKTKDGQGKVVDTQILTQLVVIERDDGTKIAVPVEELEIISSPPAVEKEEQDDTQSNEGRDDRECKKQ
jgi:cell fate regulator YaaT (PSP1 superfamily)